MCMSLHRLSYQQGVWESHAWAELIVIYPLSKQEFVCGHILVYSFIQQILSFIDSAGSSIHLNISLLLFMGYSSPPPPQKTLHSMPCAADLSWQDIIGLQSSFHHKFNTWHTSAWLGQACRWRRRRSRSPLPPIIVCGICKRALAGSFRHDKLRLHLHAMIALWTEYNRRFPNHWSGGTL